jgi:cytochrome P450
MFSSDGDELCELIGETLRRGTAAMVFPVAQLLPIVGAFWRRWRIGNVHRAFGALDSGIYGLIAKREGKPQRDPPDLLDRLLWARDSETGTRMTTEEVRDEVVIIFLAGHETTAVALTFAWYLLGLHPHVEGKLHAELDQVLEGHVPKYEDLERLVYTRMVIEETMRLYPPAPGTATRMARDADTLCGRHVPAGSLVVVSPWILHHHRSLWQNPEQFDPERFAADRPRARFSYLPFGGGPRICIGASLAMAEATLILAMIAQRYRLRLVPDQKIDLRLRVTLRPKDGIRMRVERRDTA